MPACRASGTTPPMASLNSSGDSRGLPPMELPTSLSPKAMVSRSGLARLDEIDSLGGVPAGNSQFLTLGFAEAIADVGDLAPVGIVLVVDVRLERFRPIRRRHDHRLRLDRTKQPSEDRNALRVASRPHGYRLGLTRPRLPRFEPVGEILGALALGGVFADLRPIERQRRALVGHFGSVGSGYLAGVDHHRQRGRIGGANPGRGGTILTIGKRSPAQQNNRQTRDHRLHAAISHPKLILRGSSPRSPYPHPPRTQALRQALF